MIAVGASVVVAGAADKVVEDGGDRLRRWDEFELVLVTIGGSAVEAGAAEEASPGDMVRDSWREDPDTEFGLCCSGAWPLSTGIVRFT